MDPVTTGLIVGGSALAGGLGGKQSAKSASKPTKTYLQPNQQLGGMTPIQEGLGFAQDVLLNPPTLTIDPRLEALVYGGGGGGGGGNGGGGGGGGMGGHGGAGRNNYQELAQYLQGMQAPQTEWQKMTTSPEFLDVANNELILNQLGVLGDEHRENASWTMSQALAPFINSGGTMGMNGANAMFRMNLGDTLDENLLQNQSSYLSNAYGQHLGIGSASDQAHSAATAALRGNVASGYSADQGLAGDIAQANAQVKAAQTAANASKSNAQLNAALALQGFQNEAATLPYQYANAWLGNANPAYAQWATQVGQPPKQSSLGGFLTGAAGGASTGAGVAKLFG